MKQASRFKPPVRSLDPVQNVAADSEVLTRSWLKNGESLTPIQRIGHALMSLVFVGIGMMALRASIEDVREGYEMMAFYFGVGAAFFMFLGFMGLRNVLRFRAQEKHS